MNATTCVEANSTTRRGVPGRPSIRAFVRMVKTVLLPVLAEEYVPDQDGSDSDVDQDSWMTLSPWDGYDFNCPDGAPDYISHCHQRLHQRQRQQHQRREHQHEHRDPPSHCDAQSEPRDLSSTSPASEAPTTDVVRPGSPIPDLSTCNRRAHDTSIEDAVQHPVGNGGPGAGKLGLSKCDDHPAGTVPSRNAGPPGAQETGGHVRCVLPAEVVQQRCFAGTAGCLVRLGLWETAMKTGDVILQGWQLQKELTDLKEDLKRLMLSVLRNPENRDFKNSLIAMETESHGN